MVDRRSVYLETEEIFKKLKPVLGSRLDPLWLEYQLNPKKRIEMDGFLRLLAAKHLGKPYAGRPILLEPPPAEEAEGEYPLGTVLYGTRECGTFGLRQDEWIQHVGIFGRTGSGKTNVGFLIARQLLDRGIPLLVFDWKRNYRDLLQVAQPGQLAVYTVGRDVAPFTFNPLIPPPGTSPSIWLKKLIEIICHVYWLGEGVAYLLQRALDNVYAQFGVFGGRPEVWPTLKDIDNWLNSVKVRGREAQWMDSTRRAIATLCYGDIGRVVNSPSPTDPLSLLNRSAILELDALTNSDKTFLIEALLLWIHHFRLQERGRETFKHAIIIEEAHHVLLKHKSSKETIMDVILREIRELGEAIILIDQHPSLISVPSLGNTYTTIAMNLKHGADVSTIGSAMLLDSEERDYLGRLPVGHGIVRLQGRWHKPFAVRFPLLEVEKGKVRDERLRTEPLSDSGAVCEIRLPEAQRAEILPIRPAEKLTEREIEFLKDVMGNMTSGIVERYRGLGLSSYLGNKLRSSLASRGLIEAIDIPTDKARIRLLCLRDEGAEALSNAGIEIRPRGRGGAEHEYWKAKVADRLRACGYDVEVEKPIGGGKTIDLVATKGVEQLAVEIETGHSNVVANVAKCLDAGYVQLAVLATRRSLVPALRRVLAGVTAAGVELIIDDVQSLAARLGKDQRQLNLPADDN